LSISIDWPQARRRGFDLTLKATGRVVRSDGGKVAVQFDSFELQREGSRRLSVADLQQIVGTNE
jgi:hypothetical protein